MLSNVIFVVFCTICVANLLTIQATKWHWCTKMKNMKSSSSWPTPFLPLGWIERIAVGRKFSAEPPGGSVSYRKLSFPTLWLLSHNIFPLFYKLFNRGDIEMSTKGITHKARYQGTRCRRCQVSWGWYICPICNLQYWAPMKWTKVQF